MPSKKKTNKQSKLKNVLNALNPRSLKGGILLFTIVFALGGGGYFLYKSHADPLPAALSGLPAPIYTWVGGAGGIDGVAQDGTATIVHDTILSPKSGANSVWKLTLPSTRYGASYVKMPDSELNYVINKSSFRGHKTLTCVLARGSGSGHNLTVDGVDGAVVDEANYLTSNSSYQTYCSKVGTISGSYNPSIGATYSYNPHSADTLYIANITFYVF